MTLTAEVVSIGDELTSGQRLDTNSQWLSQRLGELGVKVLYHTTVADDLEANVSVFETAIARTDVVVATGGLGPTADDLTREVLAKAVGRELVLDEPSLEHIRQLFARYKRDMPERNRIQAMFPEGSRIIFNPNGTAPGIAMDVARPSGGMCHIFALPGVPAEMFEMFKNDVAAAVGSYDDHPRVIRHHRVKCFGAGESHVEQMLPDLIRRGRSPSVGITVHDATITLRITAEGASAAECEALIAPTIETIQQCLGSLVFGSEDDELEDAVSSLLKQSQQTLYTVEMGTGGAIAGWLHRAAVNSPQFLGGQILQGPEILERWLGDNSRANNGASESAAAVASTSGQVVASLEAGSREVVEKMATHARRLSGADVALVVGPFPPNDRADPAQPYYFALATPAKVTVKAASLAGHPSIWVPRAAKGALNLLRLTLMGEA